MSSTVVSGVGVGLTGCDVLERFAHWASEDMIKFGALNFSIYLDVGRDIETAFCALALSRCQTLLSS